MAIWIKWNEKQKKIFADWLAERPAVIQEMVQKHNLKTDCLYRLKTTGKRVTIHSFHEDGTLTVNVLMKYNRGTILMPHTHRPVFGIKPEDLEECDWDGPVEDGDQVMRASQNDSDD